MLVAAVLGVTGVSMLMNRQKEIELRSRRDQMEQEEAERRQNDARFTRHTGIYGDVSEITEILQQPGAVVRTTPGVDLAGSPFVWLHLQNGAIYRSYDTKNAKVLEERFGR